ncbi:hypothetical protein PCO31010_00565 [Pandoraea commovens]|uniref:Uncharacterized protein n=2 Tax=Pandoraea commovens TaxID=2508289 RepID=A0A5E4S6B4_9BURK|nr:hypothetical protein PCO31010_00565 [Pandoraea commovens]
MPGMSQTELSSSAGPSDARMVEHAAEHAADAMIERRYPSDIDRLREVVGTDVLPHYRDEQAIVASEQASERWPHLVAVADARAGAASASPLSQSSKHSAGTR